MEREPAETPARRARESSAADDDLALDDEEFASVEDTGPEPSENPAVDDV
jgi:hypothetical protein